MIYIRVKTGYLYHIKDEFFDIVNDNTLMQNHENGKTRPTYYAIKENDMLWFIPLSTKVQKYQKIIDKKIKKYGFCNTIIIDKIFDEDQAILIQNAFPTLEKYVDHVHIIKGNEIKVSNMLEKEIYENFIKLMILHKNGKKVFFSDIDRIKNIMINEKSNNKIDNLSN